MRIWGSPTKPYLKHMHGNGWVVENATNGAREWSASERYAQGLAKGFAVV